MIKSKIANVDSVISEIADLKLPEKMWPKLLDFLIIASDSPAAHEREIYNLFAKALKDPKSLEVRATTVQALGRVSEFMKANKKSSIKDPVGQQPDQTTGSRSDRVEELRRGRGVGNSTARNRINSWAHSLSER
ncbi:hypothetical protein BY996DRAFT_6415972 [Phakopsora pachyrhizi]|nr:hypothetical protein BY996DRAFT_6415972 [Phakopsora pachyrhizi]